MATIYSLQATANSHINTVYTTAYFVGGAVCTYVGIVCWKWGGWPMVTGQLLLWSLLAFGVAASGWRSGRKTNSIA